MSSHAIKLPRVYIADLNATELHLTKMVHAKYQYEIETKEYDLQALTLTLRPAEWTALDKNISNAIGYLTSLLINLKIEGVFATELTKRGVVHIHGIILPIITPHGQKETLKGGNLIKRVQRRNKKYDVYYTWSEITNQHVIKPLKSTRQFNAWVKYMTKNLTPITVLQYLKEEEERIKSSKGANDDDCPIHPPSA